MRDARTDSETSRTDKVACHIESSGRRSARSAHCDDLTMSFGIRHVFSKPAVASSFDFNKSNFEVLELTWGTLELTRTVCHIERSRDAKPDVIATCTYARVLDYARTDSETSRTDRDCGHWAQWNSDDNLNEIATDRSRSAVTERSRNVLNLVVWHLKTLQKQ